MSADGAVLECKVRGNLPLRARRSLTGVPRRSRAPAHPVMRLPSAAGVAKHTVPPPRWRAAVRQVLVVLCRCGGLGSGDVRQDVRHPRNPRVIIITMSETAGSSAELRLRRRAQGGCAVEGKLRAISNRATTTMRHESATTATTTMRLLHAGRRSRGMCCEGRIEERRTKSRIGRLQREDGSVGRPLRGPL